MARWMVALIVFLLLPPAAFGANSSKVSAKPAPKAVPAVINTPMILPPLEEAFVYDNHAQRDPFRPLVTASGAVVTYDTSFAVAEMVLEGIVSDGDGGIAIINGTVVEQGKLFGQYIVEKIDPDKVILVRDGQPSELRIKKEE